MNRALKIVTFAVAAVAVGSAAPVAVAQEQPPAAAVPPLLQQVIACRNEANEQTRLRCYDAAVATLGQATSSGALVVVDREDVRRTRRSLFGFSLPRLPFFSGDNSQDDQSDEVEATIQSAREMSDGKWMLTLDTGAVWRTTQVEERQRLPRTGDSVTLRDGPFGSYMISVEGGRSIRAMRVR